MSDEDDDVTAERDQPVTEIIIPAAAAKPTRVSVQGATNGRSLPNGTPVPGPLTLADLRSLIAGAEAHGAPPTAVVKGTMLVQTFLAVEW